jgi:hypothetical protein
MDFLRANGEQDSGHDSRARATDIVNHQLLAGLAIFVTRFKIVTEIDKHPREYSSDIRKNEFDAVSSAVLVHELGSALVNVTQNYSINTSEH